jgi:Tol biopolymer transport system component
MEMLTGALNLAIADGRQPWLMFRLLSLSVVIVYFTRRPVMNRRRACLPLVCLLAIVQVLPAVAQTATDNSLIPRETLFGNPERTSPRISPDGQRIAVTAVDTTGNTRDIWLFDLARNVHTRFTFSRSAADAVWSPDGNRVAYSTNDATGGSLFAKSATGTTGEELLLHIPGMVRPWSWSADGRFIAYMQRSTLAHGEASADKFDIWILPLFGERKPFAFLRSDYEKDTPSFSPNGRWIAYSSIESGSSEVYVVSFPDATTKVQVSNQGGFSPVWRRDGKELYYLSLGGQLTAVSVDNNGSSLRLGSPVPLFPTDFTLSRGSGPVFQRQPFDVSPKGERFVATSSSVDASREALPVTVVVNWDAKLNKP